MATVWLINGLCCKILNWAPRHQQIVGEILGDEYARLLTILIGMSEVVMAIWIIAYYKPKFNATTQILVVGAMNILEFILVPELLLWGKLNAVFAMLFMAIVYYNEFKLKESIKLG